MYLKFIGETFLEIIGPLESEILTGNFRGLLRIWNSVSQSGKRENQLREETVFILRQGILQKTPIWLLEIARKRENLFAR
jgi:hypothetical protein